MKENNFSTTLKDYRIRKELSQEQLSKKLGISRPTLSFLENGNQAPSIKILQKIKDKLGLDLFDTVKNISDQERAYYGSPSAGDNTLNVMAELINAQKEARSDLRKCIELFESLRSEILKLPSDLKAAFTLIEGLVMEAEKKL